MNENDNFALVPKPSGGSHTGGTVPPRSKQTPAKVEIVKMFNQCRLESERRRKANFQLSLPGRKQKTPMAAGKSPAKIVELPFVFTELLLQCQK